MCSLINPVRSGVLFDENHGGNLCTLIRFRSALLALAKAINSKTVIFSKDTVNQKLWGFALPSYDLATV